MSDDESAKLAALCRNVAANLAEVAGKLTALRDPPGLRPLDVAALFLTTGANVLMYEFGAPAAIQHLRVLADKIERGEVRTDLN